MKRCSRKIVAILIPLTALVMGAVGGYLLYRCIWCDTENRTVTGNDFISIAIGGVFGLLMTTLFCTKQDTEKITCRERNLHRNG